MTSSLRQFVLLLSCADRMGIVAAVANSLLGQGCNILENAQHAERESGRFFLRVQFAAPPELSLDSFDRAFAPIGAAWNLEWRLHDLSVQLRALIMVSKGGHCLNDLLYRTSTGRLPVTVTSVVSNHENWRRRVEHEGIPFHHLPVNAGTKETSEDALLALIETEQVDLVILARYMQVLSDRLCTRLPGRVINIHHSFLPGFKGARPYHAAYARGVKMVGATAHYVTADLDEGPIIAQDVSVIDHADGVEDLIAQGQDTESRVLARAVKAHCERRISLNGNRTVVFR
jgi:formyltetrahydrofolate deformylase